MGLNINYYFLKILKYKKEWATQDECYTKVLQNLQNI